MLHTTLKIISRLILKIIFCGLLKDTYVIRVRTIRASIMKSAVIFLIIIRITLVDNIYHIVHWGRLYGKSSSCAALIVSVKVSWLRADRIVRISPFRNRSIIILWRLSHFEGSISYTNFNQFGAKCSLFIVCFRFSIFQFFTWFFHYTFKGLRPQHPLAEVDVSN